MFGGLYLTFLFFWTLLFSFWASPLLVLLLVPDYSFLSGSSLLLLSVTQMRWPQDCVRCFCSHVHTLSHPQLQITCSRPFPGWQTQLSNCLLDPAGLERFSLIPPSLCPRHSPCSVPTGRLALILISHPHQPSATRSHQIYLPNLPSSPCVRETTKVLCHLEAPIIGVFSQPHFLLC